MDSYIIKDDVMLSQSLHVDGSQDIRRDWDAVFGDNSYISIEMALNNDNEKSLALAADQTTGIGVPGCSVTAESDHMYYAMRPFALKNSPGVSLTDALLSVDALSSQSSSGQQILVIDEEDQPVEWVEVEIEQPVTNKKRIRQPVQKSGRKSKSTKSSGTQEQAAADGEKRDAIRKIRGAAAVQNTRLKQKQLSEQMVLFLDELTAENERLVRAGELVVPNFHVNKFKELPYPSDCRYLINDSRSKRGKAASAEVRTQRNREVNRKAQSRTYKRNKFDELQRSEAIAFYEAENDRISDLIRSVLGPGTTV